MTKIGAVRKKQKNGPFFHCVKFTSFKIKGKKALEKLLNIFENVTQKMSTWIKIKFWDAYFLRWSFKRAILSKKIFSFFSRSMKDSRYCSLVRRCSMTSMSSFFEVKRSCELVMVENDVYSFQDKNEMWPKKLPSFQTKKINCELVWCVVWCMKSSLSREWTHIFFKWIIFGLFFETVFSCRPRSALKKNKNALKVPYHQQRSTFFPHLNNIHKNDKTVNFFSF